MRIITTTLLLSYTLTSFAADWPQFRGPNRDGVSTEKGLAKQWPEKGPKLLWKSEGLGGGWSSVAIADKTIYTMGDLEDACYLFALNLQGKQLWKARVGEPKGHRGYPGPRSTPTVSNGHVYVLGQYGDLVCISTAGKEVWRTNIESNYGGRMMSGWKWSESPLVDDGKVVVTPGGTKGGVLALDAKTGKQVWRCKGFTDSAGYSSLIVRDFGGVKQYIQVSGKSVVGVDSNNGEVLWQAPRAGKTAVVSNPIFHEGSLFVTSSYGVGCSGFEVTGTGGNFKVKETYANKSIANHHGGCIRVGDYVYGASGSVLVCLNLKTGKEMWKERSAGKGAIVVVGDKIILRAESKGTISLVELNPNAYKEISRFEQPERTRKKAWAHPVVCDGTLYIRDQGLLLAYDLR
ncbi:MAG: PQQ-like beta-propeller repeat protein [Verrucomicrobiota bacterium]|jgi:outer membrane protein assembly factor BamB|nr:PQQ-like beta-propeller repeat protein [Verrucomicrobiota bacterium]